MQRRLTAPRRSSIMRYEALDGWRGVAAVMVALFHFPLVFFGAHSFPIRQGWLFVDFFFVLSGFVINHAYGAEIASAAQFWRFLRRRFFRLYPLHLAMLLSFVALEACVDAARGFAARHTAAVNAIGLFREFTAARLVKHALLLQGFSSWEDVGFNLPSWSISVEFWVYVQFGLATLALASRERVWRLVFAPLAVAGYIWLPWGADAPWDPFFRCLAGFSAGAALDVLRQTSRPIALSSGVATALEVAAVALAIGFLARVDAGASSRAAAVPFCLLVAVFSFEAGALSAVLRSPPLAAMGARSYSLYMVHFAVLAMIKLALLALDRFAGVAAETSPALGNAAVAIYLISVWLAAGVTLRWIETPGRALAPHAPSPRVRATAQNPLARS